MERKEKSLWLQEIIYIYKKRDSINSVQSSLKSQTIDCINPLFFLNLELVIIWGILSAWYNNLNCFGSSFFYFFVLFQGITTMNFTYNPAKPATQVGTLVRPPPPTDVNTQSF